MFSLAYTPAYDPYHTVLRFLVLLSSSENHSMSYRAIRAADFFLCFPWSLKDVRAPKEIEGFSKSRNSILKKYPKTAYDNFANVRVVFDRMEMIQATAFSALAGANMIDESDFESGRLTLKQDNIPPDLMDSVRSFTERMSDLVQFLAASFPRMEELGKDGIFARSRLGEFSYDVV